MNTALIIIKIINGGYVVKEHAPIHSNGDILYAASTLHECYSFINDWFKTHEEMV